MLELSVHGSSFCFQLRTGIGGIERNIQKKNMATDKTIAVAFEDLSKLMDKVGLQSVWITLGYIALVAITGTTILYTLHTICMA